MIVPNPPMKVKTKTVKNNIHKINQIKNPFLVKALKKLRFNEIWS